MVRPLGFACLTVTSLVLSGCGKLSPFSSLANFVYNPNARPMVETPVHQGATGSEGLTSQGDLVPTDVKPGLFGTVYGAGSAWNRAQFTSMTPVSGPEPGPMVQLIQGPKVADARVRVLDGAFHPIADADGLPILDVTDQYGQYAVPKLPANQAYLVVVQLAAGQGDLRRLVPSGTPSGVAQDVDLYSTLTARFLMSALPPGQEPQRALSKITPSDELAVRNAIIVTGPAVPLDLTDQTMNDELTWLLDNESSLVQLREDLMARLDS